MQFTLPESALPLLASQSTRFEVEFDNYRGVKFPAVLKDYAKTSSDASGFPVSLRLTNADPGRYPVSPGMSCTITMQSADPVPDAVSLPVSAIFAPAEGGTYVWIVTGDGPCRAPRGDAGRAVRPRPRRGGQRRGAGRARRHGGRLSAAAGRAGANPKVIRS